MVTSLLDNRDDELTENGWQYSGRDRIRVTPMRTSVNRRAVDTLPKILPAIVISPTT